MVAFVFQNFFCARVERAKNSGRRQHTRFASSVDTWRGGGVDLGMVGRAQLGRSTPRNFAWNSTTRNDAGGSGIDQKAAPQVHAVMTMCKGLHALMLLRFLPFGVALTGARRLQESAGAACCWPSSAPPLSLAGVVSGPRGNFPRNPRSDVLVSAARVCPS